MGGEELREISGEELSSHTTEKDLWVVIDGVVYDLTKFASEHPGGEQVLLEQAGQDASESFHDVGHSKDAIEMKKEYAIGKLKGATSAAAHSKSDSAPVEGCSMSSYLKEIFTSPTWSNFLIPTAIGIGVYLVYKAVISRFI